MAVVSVTTDLSGAGTINTATSLTGWSEPTGSGSVSGQTYADMKSIQTEPDVYIEGTGSISGAWTTNNPERGGIIYNNASTTVPTDGAIMIWIWWISPLALNPYATAGLGALIGNATNALRVIPVSGSNLAPAPKGGWYCFPVDPANATNYETIGSPTATINYIGGSLSGPDAQSRGLTHFAVDVIRVGRCTAVVTGGTGADPDAVFSDISDALNTDKYGIFEEESGSFFLQGLLQFGDNTSGTGEVVFSDINKNINIRNTPQVGPNFNRIEIQNGSTVTSNVTFNGCTFTNIGVGNTVVETASRGDFVVVDATAVLSITSCAFVDMGTFSFGSGSTLSGTAFRRCETVTNNSASLTSCTFRDTISDVALILSDDGDIDGCTFIGDGTSHAVDLGTITSGGETIVSWNHTISGTYAGTNAGPNATSTSGDSEVILVDYSPPTPATDRLIINVTGGDTPTYRNTGTGTILVQAAVTVTISGILGNSEVSVLSNPSPYTQNGATPNSLFNEDVIAAVTGTDIELDTGGGSNVTQILSTTTDFTTIGLVAGDFIRITQRNDLRVFDTFEVVSVSTNSIDVVDVASTSIRQQDLIDSPGETVTVEKVGASYQFSINSGATVDMLVYRVGSLPFYILNQTITSTNNSFPIAQALDRNYLSFEV